jgi:hypothetical protein
VASATALVDDTTTAAAVAPSAAVTVLNEKVPARREAAMSTPEEKYYDVMNTLLAPVRWAKSLLQTVLIILLLIGAGLFYPIIQLFNNGHVTFGGFMVSFLTALFIFTFFYAPWYTALGGIICFVVFYACCFSKNFVDSLTGAGFSLFIFMFLAVGILQSYIRRRAKAAKEPPKPEYQDIWAQLNQGIFEKLTREYDAMDEEVRDSMIRRHGSNYRLWPRPWPERTSDTAPEETNERSNSVAVCEECNRALSLLDLPLGASSEDVNSKKRAFAELFHDDRLGAMSENARRIAKEQHQSINEACSHILTCPVRTQLRGGINGSEAPQAPHQSTSETREQEKTEHRPPSASASGEIELARQEHGHKVLTEQERIDALDATRRKVDETTKEIHDFLEQMKGRKQTSLERL